MSCRAFEKTATELMAKKHRYASDPVTVESAHASGRGTAGQQYVLASLHQNRVHIVDGKGTVVSTDKEQMFESTVALVWGVGGWKVYDTA